MVTKISYLNFLYKFLTHSSIKLRIFIQHCPILTNIHIISVRVYALVAHVGDKLDAGQADGLLVVISP